MKILHESDLPLKMETAVAIGLFDGIHLGHLALLKELEDHENTLVFTFDYKPQDYESIYTNEEKISIFESLGIGYYFMQRFKPEFASLSPEAFLAYLKESFGVRHITVGYDFRFGKGARGDDDFLIAQKEAWGYSLSIVPEVDAYGEKVSSTRIRSLIKKGEVALAARLLSRFYFVDGVVGRGARLGGKIGFPTVNIVTDKLLPAYGVYATLVKMDGKLYRGVTNVGVKPTVSDAGIPNIETYLLDFEGQAYGNDIRVYFVDMLRTERRFDSVEELSARIALDSGNAAALLADMSVYKAYIV